MAFQTVVFVLAFIGGFTSAYAEKTDLNDILFSGNYEFVDLTHPFDNNTVYWINSNKFSFIRQVAHEDVNGSWYAVNDFSAGEHGGTHLDAPYHFFKEGLHVGDLPLEKLIVPLIVVDVSSKTNDNPNFVLTKHDLDDGLINYNMGKPCLMVFKFGWSKYFNDEKKYLGLSDDRTLNFPGLSGELVQWLTTAYKNIVGIGVDVASVDPGSSTDFPVHKITSRSGLYNVENINFHKNIPEHGCTALVLPMKIASGTGAPLRLVAICPKQTL